VEERRQRGRALTRRRIHLEAPSEPSALTEVNGSFFFVADAGFRTGL